MTEKMGNTVFLETVFHNIYGWTFNDIKKADLITFPVCSDRLIKGNFPGSFFSGAEHHEKFVVNAACRIGGQLGSTAGIKSRDCFDQADGADGYQIIGIFVATLVFFCDMGHKTEITFDENVFCLRIAPLELQKIKFFFRSRQRFQKCFQRFTSKGISIQFMKWTCFSCFSNRIFTGVSSCCASF